MVTRIFVVVAWLGLPARADTPPPPLEEAIQQASAAHKPLVLEFHADWCGPCREFAAKTLPEPRVQKALEDVVFVRYDAEASPGSAAAAKYSVTSYPTFVVVDRQGIQRLRHQGAPLGATGIATFVELLGKAHMATLEEAEVREYVKSKPNDVEARLVAARWYVDRQINAEAKRMFDAISTHPASTPAQRAEATAAAVRLRRMEQWKAQLLGEKVALVRASSQHASDDDLVMATVGSGLPIADARRLVKLVIDAEADTERLNGLVYVAIAAGAHAEALAAAQRVVDGQRDAQHLDTLAECYYVMSDRKHALEIEDEALHFARGGTLRRTLETNRSRFERGTTDASEVTQLRLRSADLWQRLEKVDQLVDHVDDPLHDEAQRIIRAEMSHSLKVQREVSAAIAKACVKDAGSSKEAIARIDLDAQGHASSSTRLLLDPDAPKALRVCLTNQLAAARLPGLRGDKLSLTIEFAP